MSPVGLLPRCRVFTHELYFVCYHVLLVYHNYNSKEIQNSTECCFVAVSQLLILPKHVLKKKSLPLFGEQDDELEAEKQPQLICKRAFDELVPLLSIRFEWKLHSTAVTPSFSTQRIESTGTVNSVENLI